MVFAVIFLVFLVFTSCAENAKPYAVPVDKSVRISGLAYPPTIDGKVNSKEWEGATVIDDFVPTHTGKGKPSEGMKAYLGYDRDYLYLGVVCEESNPKGMKVTKYEKDSGVYSDDCVELFFDINHDQSTYFHLVVNPVGALYDSSVIYQEGITSMDSDWDSDAEVKATIGEHEWMAELAIPFSKLGLNGPPAEACWGLNVNRVQRRIAEYVSWSVTGGSFHQPKNFGRMIWGADTYIQVANLDFNNLVVRSANKLSFITHNRGGKDQTIPAKLTIIDAQQEVVGIEKLELNILANSSTSHFMKLPILSFGDYLLKLEVGDEKLYIDDTYRISFPPPVNMALDQYAYYNQEDLNCEFLMNPDYAQMHLALTLISFGDEAVEQIIKPGSFTAAVKKLEKSNFDTGKVQLSFQLGELKVGKYKLLLEMKNGKEKVYAQESIFRIINNKKDKEPVDIKEVTAGKNNCFFVNGQPFFPNGLYHVPAWMYPEVKEQGFNAVQIHPRDLDEAHEYGLKGLVVLYPGMTVNLDFIRKTVLAYKDHPAVLMWLLLDEPDINKGSPETMLEAYQLIKTLDSKHPVSFVLIQPSSFEKYHEAVDLITTDPYPIPFDSVAVVGKIVDEAHKVIGDTKPVWTVLQSFGRYSIWEREPTAYEARAMAYIALNHGVTAFSWYCLDDRPEWWLADSTQLWSFFKALNWELEELLPILVSSKRAVSVQCDSSRALDISVREFDDAYYIFAVNTAKEPTTVAFQIPDYKSGKVEVMFDNYSLELKTGQWSEELEPLGVRVYKISK